LSRASWIAAAFFPRSPHLDVVGKAAVLFRSMIKNHPFVDGKKRTAVIGTVTFLEKNGFEVFPRRWKELALEVAETEGNYPIGRLRERMKKLTKYNASQSGTGLSACYARCSASVRAPTLCGLPKMDVTSGNGVSG
jgi:hypothetical protein